MRMLQSINKVKRMWKYHTHIICYGPQTLSSITPTLVWSMCTQSHIFIKPMRHLMTLFVIFLIYWVWDQDWNKLRAAASAKQTCNKSDRESFIQSVNIHSFSRCDQTPPLQPQTPPHSSSNPTPSTPNSTPSVSNSAQVCPPPLWEVQFNKGIMQIRLHASNIYTDHNVHRALCVKGTVEMTTEYEIHYSLDWHHIIWLLGKK